MATGQVVWRARRDPQDLTDTDLYDVAPLKLTVSRLADDATLLFRDPTGSKKSDYPRGQRVSLLISTNGTAGPFTRRRALMVQDTSPVSHGAGDFLRVKLVGYDHWLTTIGVYRRYESQQLITIIEDLITRFTPVNYVAGNIDLSEPNRVVTRRFAGETVNQALDYLVTLSNDENYGVNDDFEFFIEQAEVTDAPDDLLVGDWVDYDVEDVGRAAYNRVELFYGEEPDRRRVSVEDTENQSKLQESLGAPRPVVRSIEDHYPEIDNEEAAEEKAREILQRRKPLTAGTVSSFERFNNQPNQRLRLQITEKNIDAVFRIARLEYYWRQDETLHALAQEGPDVEKLLVQMAGQVHRVNMRGTDTDAVLARILEYELPGENALGLEVHKRRVPFYQFAGGVWLGGVGAVGLQRKEHLFHPDQEIDGDLDLDGDTEFDGDDPSHEFIEALLGISSFTSWLPTTEQPLSARDPGWGFEGEQELDGDHDLDGDTEFDGVMASHRFLETLLDVEPLRFPYKSGVLGNLAGGWEEVVSES